MTFRLGIREIGWPACWIMILLFLFPFACTPPSMIAPIAEQNLQNMKSYSQNVDRSLSLTERVLSSWLELRVTSKSIRITDELLKFAADDKAAIEGELDSRVGKLKPLNEKIAELSPKVDGFSKEQLKIYVARKESLEEADPVAGDVAKNIVTKEEVAKDSVSIAEINRRKDLSSEERNRLKNAVVKKYSFVSQAEASANMIREAFKRYKGKIDEQRNIAFKHALAIMDFSKTKPSFEDVYKTLTKEDVQGSILEIIKTTWGEKEASVAGSILGELKEGGK